MIYSSLVNSLGLDNPLEMNMYSSYGCMVMLAMDMDLMCSSTFDMRDLGRMRVVGFLAQRVAHIGNMLNTYPGELAEKDVSSPIISAARNSGLIDKEDLGKRSVLPSLSNAEGS